MVDRSPDGEERGSQLPSAEYFIGRLRASLEYCEKADDRGSVDHEMGRWQNWIKEWPQIFDENGGL